jgi:V/A-type H+/Na+-transporting ATPase subunit D
MEELSYSVPYSTTFEILGRSIMNVEIPIIRHEAEKIKPHYGFFRTNSAVDLVLVQMNEAQKLIFRMAEVENAVYRLALEIRSTNKRANALEKIQIRRTRT